MGVNLGWLTPVILLATWEAEIWKIMFPGQPRQNSHDPISTNGWPWFCAPVIPAMAGSSNNGSQSRPAWIKRKTLYQKYARQKRLEVWLKR
jgi:hypothetical protein